jgi:dUTP pyrophosphatase
MEAQLRPRSGLARDFGITVLNSPGTIDSDYRDEVAVLLINHGTEVFHVKRGMRVAQMVLAPVRHASIKLSSTPLPKTERKGGFGSTGV